MARAISTRERDWGHARDYVEGHVAHRPTGHVPDDFVLATGETPTVREFVDPRFRVAGRDIEWTGKGVDEKGLDARTGVPLIEIDPRYFRPTEVDLLLGNPAKAPGKLGWSHYLVR